MGFGAKYTKTTYHFYGSKHQCLKKWQATCRLSSKKLAIQERYVLFFFFFSLIKFYYVNFMFAWQLHISLYHVFCCRTSNMSNFKIYCRFLKNDMNIYIRLLVGFGRKVTHILLERHIILINWISELLILEILISFIVWKRVVV